MRPALLRERREHQIDRHWHQYPAGSAVEVLSDPQPLISIRDGKPVRQMTRWPEDWAPDFAASFDMPVWCLCRVGDALTQIREQDLVFDG